MTNCLVRDVRVPENILRWSRLAREYQTNEQVAASEFADIAAKFCNLQATIKVSGGCRDPVTTIALALTIDAELVDWADRFPNKNTYTVVILKEKSAEVFADYWHSYRDIWIAAVWNHYRSIRILVNQIILAQLARLTEHLPFDSSFHFSSLYDHQIEASKTTIVELSHKICASVPFYLGHHHNDRRDWTPGYQPQNAAHGKLLLWPLHVAGESDLVSAAMRTWVVERLENVAQVMGLEMARVLAQALKTNHQTTEWGTQDTKGWRELTAGTRMLDLFDEQGL